MRDRVHESFGLDGVLISGEGFRITRVDPDSPAARLGLECGDVVTRVFGFPAEHAEVYRLLTEARPMTPLMRIEVRDWRGNGFRTIRRA